jgi:4'-phosphopantetheinyl transferase
LGERVYWCLRQAPQLSIAWDSLSPVERTTYEGFRFDARRKSWLAGRFTAKFLVSSVHDGHFRPDQIEIRNDELGAPSAYHAGQPLPGCLSISHAEDWAAAAFSPLEVQSSGMRVGIDLETITPRSEGFIRDYFTQHEADLVSAAHAGSPTGTPHAAQRATLIWSAKEALLKAMGIGLRLDTRRVEVIAIGDEEGEEPVGWKRLGLSSNQVSSPIDAYWRRIGRYVVTLVVLNDAATNIALIEVQ